MRSQSVAVLLALLILYPDISSTNLILRFSQNVWDRHSAAVESEEERVGQAALSSVVDGVTGRLERVVSGVKSAVDGVRSTVEGVAGGVKSTVDGAVHDAGEVLGSVIESANPAIFPGTNWCGAGDRAKGYNDFGVFGTADLCCRAHDSCPLSMGAGEGMHGLKNEAPFTQSFCECDKEFYWCLKNSTSLVAKKIGIMFFNILRMRCFTYDFPLTCAERSLMNRCEKYTAEPAKPKDWQWIDNPSF